MPPIFVSALVVLVNKVMICCCSVRWSLCSKVQEVRAGALRVLRYLITDENAYDVFCSYHLHILVVR